MAVIAALVDHLSRVPGVRGAVVAARRDGIVVAEALHEGLDGDALAALATSLLERCGRVARAAGREPPALVQLRATGGTLVAGPVGAELVACAVAAPDANLGLVRLAIAESQGAVA